MGEDAKAIYDMLKAAGKPIPDELREMIEGATRQRYNKYNNTKTYQDGRIYDSKKEAARAGELKLLLKAGEIAGYFEQVPFEFTGDIRYIADYVVLWPHGRYTVEDVKSEHTRTLAPYRMKRKLFRAKYGFDITEV